MMRISVDLDKYIDHQFISIMHVFFTTKLINIVHLFLHEITIVHHISELVYLDVNEVQQLINLEIPEARFLNILGTS